MSKKNENNDVEIRGEHEFQIWFTCFLAAYNKGADDKKLMSEANKLFSAVAPYKRQLDASREEFMNAQKAQKAAMEAQMGQLKAMQEAWKPKENSDD